MKTACLTDHIHQSYAMSLKLLQEFRRGSGSLNPKITIVFLLAYCYFMDMIMYESCMFNSYVTQLGKLKL